MGTLIYYCSEILQKFGEYTHKSSRHSKGFNCFKIPRNTQWTPDEKLKGTLAEANYQKSGLLGCELNCYEKQ
jgi:hypothetical protein